MSRKILAFLSNQEPKQRYPYAHRGAIYSGSYFPEALIKFCPYDEMLIFVTADARRKSWPYFESLGRPNIRAVDIPDGRSSEEIWQIFRTVAAAVQPGDTVVIDITHAMRFLPFLVFLFVSYLKFSGRGALEAIYYGAVQYGPNNTIESASVVDLTEFAKMLEWIGAAEQFTRSGNGAPMARLLASQADAALEANDPLAHDALTRAGHIIDQVSRALAFNMPLEVISAAHTLREQLPGLLESGARFAPQMHILGDRLRELYVDLAQPPITAHNRASLIESVRRQHGTAMLHLQNNNFFHCALLLHETLVSAVMVYLRNWQFTSYDQRELASKVLHRIAKSSTDSHEVKPSKKELNQRLQMDLWTEDLQKLQSHGDLARYFQELTRLRNSLAHCGFEQDVLLQNKSLAQTRENELRNLAPRLHSYIELLLTH
jgi:CRISPR-associated DxTHG motif protein